MLRRQSQGPAGSPIRSLRNSSSSQQTPLLLFDSKMASTRYEREEDSGNQRAKSQMARRTAISGMKQASKLRRIFQINGISTEMGSRKLTHKDIVRLSEVITREATTLKSIRRILSRFEQQIKQEVVVPNSQRRHSGQTLSLRVMSKQRQGKIQPRRLGGCLCANKTVQPRQFSQRIKQLVRAQGKKSRKQFMVDSQISKTFDHKVYKYLQFLLLINLTNRVYRNLDVQSSRPLRYWIGGGNNYPIVQAIMRKRCWWQEGTKEDSNFYWTQLKKEALHQRQTKVPPKAFKKFQTSSATQRRSKLSPEQTAVLKLMDSSDWNYIRRTLGGSRNKFTQRVHCFGKSIKRQEVDASRLVTNHLPCNGLLGNKKALFLSLKLYYQLTERDLTDIIPETYHVKSVEDSQFCQFQTAFNKRKSKVWIVKPGEFSNRGQGIVVLDKLEQIANFVRSSESTGRKQSKTYILQHYIVNPFLYNRRKFDIRTYMLVTVNNGVIKAYWYDEGYIRTSSQTFGLNDLNNTFVHLTNDAVQKGSKRYGKYEDGNKLSYKDFQRYLTASNSGHNFQAEILPKMKQTAAKAVTSTCLFLDRDKHENNFQIFGLDFMITSKFQASLIQINTNPCLETGCPLLARIIPNMLENAFRIGLDPIFPPPRQLSSNRHFISENAIFFNNFELIFDEVKQRPHLDTLYGTHSKRLEQICNSQDCRHIQSVADPEQRLTQMFQEPMLGQ